MSPIIGVALIGTGMIVGLALWWYAVRNARPEPKIPTALRNDGPEVKFTPPQEPQ